MEHIFPEVKSNLLFLTFKKVCSTKVMKVDFSYVMQGGLSINKKCESLVLPFFLCFARCCIFYHIFQYIWPHLHFSSSYFRKLAIQKMFAWMWVNNCESFKSICHSLKFYPIHLVSPILSPYGKMNGKSPTLTLKKSMFH